MQVKVKKTSKSNPLKLNNTEFLSEVHNESGRYCKRYFFANGLGASVVCHQNSYGGHSGFFELALFTYQLGADEWETSKWIEGHEIQKRHGVVDVWGWLDFFQVADILQEIRNYNTGGYEYYVYAK